MRLGRRRFPTVWFTAAILFACVCAAIVYAVQHPPLPQDKDRPTQEDSIREVVFRYQFDHNASGLQKGAAVYCLSLGDSKADPSDQFIERFKGNQPPVRKRSECGSGTRGVTDTATGRQGIIFRVSSIRWISGNEVEVSGGYYESGLSGSGNTYTVVLHDGRWSVSKERMKWIS